ncbi:hypothetical protein BMS3Abin11_01740 [bacterium BMS3Abin11]|nr:hypothetical protein BMS3Abin11_01740 [bacterium BMS3Abin11]
MLVHGWGSYHFNVESIFILFLVFIRVFSPFMGELLLLCLLKEK